MNLLQINAVCEIARRKFNMSEAASVLHRSQPALSRQLAELEKELGVRIFSRTRNKIVGLTPEGEQVVLIGQRISRDVTALRQVGPRTREAAELRIVTTHTHARYSLPPTIKKFRDRWPHVMLNLRQGDPAQCVDLVASGDAHMGITVEPDRLPKDIVTIPIYRLSRCVLAPRSHPIARGRLTLQRIARYPIIAYSRPPSWKWLFEDAFVEADLKPNVVLNALDPEVSTTYVRLGMGIAVLATMSHDPDRDRDLVALAADHLFKAGVLMLVLRRGAYVSGHVLSLLSIFAPHLDEDVIRQHVDGVPSDKGQLTRKAPLVQYFGVVHKTDRARVPR